MIKRTKIQYTHLEVAIEDGLVVLYALEKSVRIARLGTVPSDGHVLSIAASGKIDVEISDI